MSQETKSPRPQSPRPSQDRRRTASGSARPAQRSRAAVPERTSAGQRSSSQRSTAARSQRSTEMPRTRELSPKARQARLKRLRRKRIRNTFLLVLILAILGGAGGFAVYTLRGGMMYQPLQEYSSGREFANDLSSLDDLRTTSFASSLCVVEKDVPLESSALSADQDGLLLDLDRKQVLFSQHAFDRVYPASITKIVTGLLVLRYGHMDEKVTIQQEDLNLEQAAQVCGFYVGDVVTVEMLLNCLLVYSGNDAAMALARTVGGSTEEFVRMMNSYAASLGCTGTHFVNPHGLHVTDHYTTPYDIYLMLKEALKYPRFTEISQQPEYVLSYIRPNGNYVETHLEATDHYLTGDAAAPRDVSILGGKTGTTSEAGNCLALLSQNAYGHPYFSLVMGAETKDVLYQQMNSLLQNIND